MSRSDERATKEMLEQRPAMLSFPVRQELVGKRFIVITEESNRRGVKNQSVENYGWKQGYIRACSVKDIHDKELQVLVEFDGASWECRQWIKIYEQTKAFFVENSIIWAARVYRNSNSTHRNALSWPALIFIPLVDYLGLEKESKHAVEYLGDKQLAFLKENEVQLYKDTEEDRKIVFCMDARVKADFLAWERLQKTQVFLMKGAETLTGARVKVYRLQLRQWYTGCITEHNLITRELLVMDDNVLQTHPVHPALVQIELMVNDEELDRILHGETKIQPTRRQRNAQIYFQSNSLSEQKSQGGLPSDWHMLHGLNTAHRGWSRPSVVHSVSRGKPAFVQSTRNEETSAQSLATKNDNSGKEKKNELSSSSHCTTKVKVHKPIPVVLKPTDTLPFSHYTPQPPRPSTSPLLSSLNSTPSPLRAQHTPSPLSGQLTPSPQSLRNQTPPQQNSKNESPFNISLCDQSSARAAAEKEIRNRNHDNNRTNHNSPTTPATSCRKTIISETPDKSKANSRASTVPSPSVSSTSTQLFPSSKNTEGKLNSGKTESKNPCGEKPIRDLSPESGTLSAVLAQSGRNFEPGVKTQREKKTLTAKNPSAGKVTTMVIDNAPGHATGETSTAQQRVISPERRHSGRVENGNTNPMSMRTEQSRCAQFSAAQACSHLHMVAKIQLEYLIFLEALVRFQHRMIVEAINTINQTDIEEQFYFVADFFCKLIEGNRQTENIFRDASLARQERERAEHQRHMSQETTHSLRSVVDCLPDEIKMRLRCAQDTVSKKREEVLSIVLPFEDWKHGKQQREWESLKQQARKQHQESVQKQQQQIEEKTPPAQRSSESQKRNNVQSQKQQHEKTHHQHVSGYTQSSISDAPNQLEISKESQKSEQHRNPGRASEETELTQNRTLSSGRIQSPRHEESIVIHQHGTRHEPLRTPQHVEQLQSLLLQREQLYEQQRYEEVQKKMVDELLQVKDMDQKTILLQHIVQALQSQKASSRDGLKSPPAINSGLASRTTESQFTNIENKHAASREADQSRTPYVSKAVFPPYPSAEQFLTSLSTASSNPLRFPENLRITSDMISKNQPTAEKTPVSKNSEKFNSQLFGEKDVSTSGSASVLPGVISSADTSAITGSANKSTKKRKSPVAPGEKEQSKAKRQRKTSKNKNASDQDVASLETTPASQHKRLAVKTAPPGKAVPLTMSSSDRNVTPVKTSDEHFLPSQYQPRSITKGIGFVPVNALSSVNSAIAKPSVITTTANHPLDVLATVSASLRTSNFVQNMQEIAKPAARSLIHPFASKNPLPTDGMFAGEARQVSVDSRVMIADNRQLSEERHSGNLAATTLNGNQQPAEQNQPHKSSRSKSMEDVRLNCDDIPMSFDRVKTAKFGLGEESEKAWDEAERKQSLSEYKQSTTERSSKDNQRGTSVISVTSKHAAREGILSENDKTDSITDKMGKDRNTYDGSKKIQNKTVEGNSVDLDGSVNEVKKEKRQRPKKDKKTKIETPKLDSKDRTKTKAKDHTPSSVEQNMSLQNFNGNENNTDTSEPLRQLSSNHDIKRKVKQTFPMVDALSLGPNNSNNSFAFMSTDCEMKEAAELSKLLPLKPIVSDCLDGLDVSKKCREGVLEDISKPSSPTIVSQNIQSLNVGYDKIVVENKSNNASLTAKEKEMNKEAINGKKAAKKENKSKPEASKTRKPSEKKQKTPENSMQEKGIVAKSAKKPSIIKADKALTKTKKQSNQESDKLNSLASQISLTPKETTLRNLLSAPSSFLAKSNVCEDKVKSLEQLVIDNESKKSNEATVANLENIEQGSGILQELLSSEFGLVRSMEDTTTVANASKEAGKSGEIPKKPKHKSSSSEAQNKTSATDKIKTKTSKDEKITKNNKKPRKKSEKTVFKALESNSVTKEEKKVAGTAVEDSAIVNEILSSLVHESKLNNNGQPGEETTPEVMTTNTVECHTSKTEKKQEREDIVFVNDLSVGDFVKARQNEVPSENLLPKKRKRCTSPSINDPAVVSESSDIESSAHLKSTDTTATDKNKIMNKKPSSKPNSTENSENKDGKVRKKKVKKENAVDEAKNDIPVIIESDTPALDNSVKQDVKKDSEAKKKNKKPKESKEKKVREKIPKEEWSYFLQRGGCKALPTMPQCRECRNYETEEEAIMNKSCCRFDMFRRCRSKSNKMEMAGFSSSENAQGDDLLPWIAGKGIGKFLSLEVSKYILLNVGDEFCNLVQREEEAFSWQTKKDCVAWKRAVRGIREMCDACATTIFNVHWVCPKCGFGVCLDCYRTRMNMAVSSAEVGRAKRFSWVRCSANTSHRPQRLVLTHIIPKKTLHDVGEQLHKAREFWGIGEHCPCKRRSIEGSAKIKELPGEENGMVVDVVAENTTVPQDKVEDFEEANTVEKIPELPMETESLTIPEKEPEEQTASGETDDKHVKTETDKESENILSVIETIQDQHAVPAEVNKSAELMPNYQDDKSMEEEKVPEDNIVAPLSENQSILGDKSAANDVNKQFKNEDDKIPETCDDARSFVRIAEDGIGALSLLMDYESPVSSPVSSPVREMTCSEITPAEAVLLSRPSATHAESSEMVDTSSEAARESPVKTDTTSEGVHESETATKSSPVTEESSAMVEESLAMVEDPSAIIAEASVMLDENVIARVEARITDEIPAPHSWICRRPMLRLHYTHHEGNLKAFQSRWEKGEPVLVSGVQEHMTSHLWTPEGFENEFGSEKADVVNCKTGGTLEKMDIGTFWRGFESVKDRPLDNKGEPTLLKLKDWPPEADFVEKMPNRFKDLMNALPLPEYTSREGTRNLVARLPDFFVKPDLGPKMYNAYGNAAFPSAGTTNLHIDMSDAVNVMVYVGVPFDDKEYGDRERRDSVACIDVACDETQQYRARDMKERLGALWHIFAAEDANKIRALFHKVCREKNMKYPTSHDPIHDQCFYLDEPLLRRLKEEYGVVGWPIAQFLGDAIFIPAGAPHQVRNLHSCVKAAEDFVSPEHVGHCFKLTEEFRHLSEKHTNHEDKLQVKNIIYHAVKDAVSVLRQHEITSQTDETGSENV